MGFTCEKCGVQFAKQRDLQSHMARKRPCDAVLSHQCQHCLKPFTRADNKSRHQTTAVPVNIEQLVFAISMAGAKSLCKVSIANKAVDVLREHQIIQQKMTTRLK